MAQSETIQCGQCGETISTAEAVTSAQGEICQSCELDLEMESGGPMSKIEDAIGLSPAGQVGLVLVLVPFALTFRINELIFTSIAGGAAGGLVALYALIQKVRSPEGAEPKFFAAIAVVELLAIYHLLDGVGVI